MKQFKIIITSCLFFALNLAWNPLFAIEDFDTVQKQINKLDEYYKAGEFKKAEACLEKIKKTIGFNDPSQDHGYLYPNCFLYAVRHYESLLIDQSGGYDHLPTFTGKVGLFALKCQGLVSAR